MTIDGKGWYGFMPHKHIKSCTDMKVFISNEQTRKSSTTESSWLRYVGWDSGFMIQSHVNLVNKIFKKIFGSALPC